MAGQQGSGGGGEVVLLTVGFEDGSLGGARRRCGRGEELAVQRVGAAFVVAVRAVRLGCSWFGLGLVVHSSRLRRRQQRRWRRGHTPAARQRRLVICFPSWTSSSNSCSLARRRGTRQRGHSAARLEGERLRWAASQQPCGRRGSGSSSLLGFLLRLSLLLSNLFSSLISLSGSLSFLLSWCRGADGGRNSIKSGSGMES
ncbi:hypothetical protein PVAP13_1NG286719 [Panicum virgatum]|uniref:Uncharacterized protein n=1 Tax=Panicum virgatum TaxID=38727 RepID=A0A8T0WZZ8_PANVG|nr:hypothetical protein PVAP13_1NG286719 [Panicum virgatum]